MNESSTLATLGDRMAGLHTEYRRRNPRSFEANVRAADSMPGGNTRTVLHFNPFPLTMRSGKGSDVWDIDGHRYADFVGEFSAGLYGHSDPVIRDAIIGALSDGIVLAAPTEREAVLAELIRARFPSMQRLRYCNSGTEANILALTTAMVFTGRKKILAFQGAYHGGVLVYSTPPNPLNLPFDVVLAPYNDPATARELIHLHGPQLAAVIVEPILGAAGNLPGELPFMQTLRDATRDVGALLIFDEVKTSRCGAGGMQRQLGIEPDMTTLGKYIGGGLSCGVFGGRVDVMSRFDPTSPSYLKHAGTFNNNACTMAAGIAGLTKVFTPQRADAFDAQCEDFRVALNHRLRTAGMPMHMVGRGSMFSAHFAPAAPRQPTDIPAVSPRLTALFHMEALLSGLLMVSRSDIFISLSIEPRHLDLLEQVVDAFIDRHGELVRELVPTH